MQKLFGNSTSRKLVKNFYLHLPFCQKKCHYCSFPIMALGESSLRHATIYDQYLKNLIAEIQSFFILGTRPIQIETLYIGGGTPSLFEPYHINKLIEKIGIMQNKSEITLEMNPQDIDKLQVFEQKVPINRFSLGIQSTNQKTLGQLNRVELNDFKFTGKYFSYGIYIRFFDYFRMHTPHHHQKNYNYLVEQLYKYSVQRNGNLNLDFIIDFNAHPSEQTHMLQMVSKIMPKHLTMYSLQINPGSFIYSNLHQYPQYRNKQFHDDQYKNYIQISEKLKHMGYHNYEVSSYCLGEQYQSKHNKVYWSGDREFGAFGMGATSLMNDFRVTRPKTLNKYYQYIDSLEKGDNFQKYLQIHDESLPIEKIKWIILSRIRTFSGLDLSDILSDHLHGLPVQQIKSDVIRSLHSINAMRGQQIIEIKDSVIRFKQPSGLMLADEIGYKIIDQIQKQYQKVST